MGLAIPVVGTEDGCVDWRIGCFEQQCLVESQQPPTNVEGSQSLIEFALALVYLLSILFVEPCGDSQSRLEIVDRYPFPADFGVLLRSLTLRSPSCFTTPAPAYSFPM